MGAVRATYVGQSETGTTFLGDFSSVLENCHAGDEVDVEVTHVGQEEKRAEAEAPAEDGESAGEAGESTEAK